VAGCRMESQLDPNHEPIHEEGRPSDYATVDSSL